jgi:hypothetical protein
MQPVAQAYLQQHRLSVARALLGCLETLLDRTPGLSLHSWRHQCHELFPAANHLSRPDVLNKQALWSMSSQWRRGKKLQTKPLSSCGVVEARKEAEFGEDTTPQFHNGFVSKVFSALGVAELRN